MSKVYETVDNILKAGIILCFFASWFVAIAFCISIMVMA
jgi:hypothetical protein